MICLVNRVNGNVSGPVELLDPIVHVGVERSDATNATNGRSVGRILPKGQPSGGFVANAGMFELELQNRNDYI